MYSLLKPLLLLTSPEFAHWLGLRVLKLIGFLHRMGLWRRAKLADAPDLSIDTPFGRLASPIGLAAGFDKNAEALWGWQALGFSFVEVGTATPFAQEGNPTPRLFRFVSRKMLVNRMGFNNQGAEKIASNIRRARQQGLRIKIGGNIGKNAITPLERAAEDYKFAALKLVNVVDYLVINVSSPNTIGLRELQSETHLARIIEAVKSVAENKPLFIKVAPDRHGGFISGVINVIKKYKLDGVICGNTLANHASANGLSDLEIACLPTGGLSGKPLFDLNLKMVQNYVSHSKDLWIIGVGGIMSGTDMKAYLSSGAKLIQIYTGLVFNGPSFVKRLLKDLLGEK